MRAESILWLVSIWWLVSTTQTVSLMMAKLSTVTSPVEYSDIIIDLLCGVFPINKIISLNSDIAWWLPSWVQWHRLRRCQLPNWAHDVVKQTKMKSETAVQCNTLQYTATPWLQHTTATHESATRCNTAPHWDDSNTHHHHSSTHCNTLQHTATGTRCHKASVAAWVTVLQCVAVCCSAL